jgi:hypothetical protein
MVTGLVLAIIFTVFPSKPDMTLKFQDISIIQAWSAAKLAGFKNDLQLFPAEGRIGLLLIEVRGNIVTAKASRFYIKGDPVRWVTIMYNRKTEFWYMKAEALGGIIEVEGVFPKEINNGKN